MKHCLSVATLAEYIGNQGALNLVQSLGGSTIKIPKRQAGTVWARLLGILGQQRAQTIVYHYGGESLYIATDAKALHDASRASVQAMRAQGKSYAEIARSHTVTRTFTERWVRKLAQAPTPAAPPPPRTHDQLELSLSLNQALQHPLHNALFGPRPVATTAAAAAAAVPPATKPAASG